MSNVAQLQSKSVVRAPLSPEAQVSQLRLELSRQRREIYNLRAQIYALATKLALFPQPLRSNWFRPSVPRLVRITITTTLGRPQLVTCYDERGKVEEYSGLFEAVGLRAMAITPRGMEWTPISYYDLDGPPTMSLPVPIPISTNLE